MLLFAVLSEGIDMDPGGWLQVLARGSSVTPGVLYGGLQGSVGIDRHLRVIAGSPWGSRYSPGVFKDLQDGCMYSARLCRALQVLRGGLQG